MVGALIGKIILAHYKERMDAPTAEESQQIQKFCRMKTVDRHVCEQASSRRKQCKKQRTELRQQLARILKSSSHQSLCISAGGQRWRVANPVVKVTSKLCPKHFQECTDGMQVSDIMGENATTMTVEALTATLYQRLQKCRVTEKPRFQVSIAPKRMQCTPEDAHVVQCKALLQEQQKLTSTIQRIDKEVKDQSSSIHDQECVDKVLNYMERTQQVKQPISITNEETGEKQAYCIQKRLCSRKMAPKKADILQMMARAIQSTLAECSQGEEEEEDVGGDGMLLDARHVRILCDNIFTLQRHLIEQLQQEPRKEHISLQLAKMSGRPTTGSTARK